MSIYIYSYVYIYIYTHIQSILLYIHHIINPMANIFLKSLIDGKYSHTLSWVPTNIYLWHRFEDPVLPVAWSEPAMDVKIRVNPRSWWQFPENDEHIVDFGSRPPTFACLFFLQTLYCSCLSSKNSWV